MTKVVETAQLGIKLTFFRLKAFAKLKAFGKLKAFAKLKAFGKLKVFDCIFPSHYL